MALPATENFAGAAGNLSDPPWTQMRVGAFDLTRDGSGIGSIESTIADCLCFWNADTFSSDHYSQVTSKFTGPGDATQYIFLIARATGDYPTGNWYWLWSDGGSDTVLSRTVSGTPTTLATANATTFATGDTLKLEVTGSGTSTVVKAYKNGVAFITFNDNGGSALSGGAPGLGGWGSPKPTFDDWVGDNVAAGVTASPGAGSLALAGNQPTAITPIVISPGSGALVFAGEEPQTPKHLTSPGDVGVLSYVGGESLVGGTEPPQVLVTQPVSGALSLTGQLVTVSIAGAGTTVTPSVGTLALAGQAPATIQNLIRAPGNGALVLAGLAPVVLQNAVVQPSVDALTLTGQAPTILQNWIAQPGSGALTLAGQSPTALTPVTVSPSVGALTLAGQAPVILTPVTVNPSAGALTLAGQSPTLLQNFLLQPGAGALTLEGQIPAALNGDAKVAQPGAGALALNGQAPTVLAAVTVAPAAGALVLAGQAPTVQSTQSAQPPTGTLVLAGQAPTLSVTANVVANPLTGALVITGATPTVSTSDHHTAAPGAGALVLTGQAPTIPIPSPTVTPDPGALFLEGLAPGIIVSGDDLLSAKFIARRPNVRMKGLQPEPRPAATPLAPEITNMPGTEEVVRRAQGLNLGLITAPPAAPVPPAAASVVEVPSIGVTVPAGPPPAAPEPAPAAPAPEPATPPTPATQDDVAALHKAILEATKVEVGAQADRVLLVLASVLEKVDDLQTKIEADAKARDLRERNMLRAKQIAERMLRDLEK